MSDPKETGEPCNIVVTDLFAMINARRKLFQLSPIEDRAMASRCTLRFNLDQQRGVDFSQEKIVIAPQDMPALQTMVNDQFGVNFDGELKTLCAKAKKPAVEPPPMVVASGPAEQPQVAPEQTGLGSKLKRLFGGR